MRRWCRLLLAILAVPLLLLLNATPQRGADRRLAAAVSILRVLLFLAAVSGFFWLVEPLLKAQDQVGRWLAIAVFGTLGTFFAVLALAGFVQMAVLLLRGRRAMATVTVDTGPCEKPLFEFADTDGRTHRVSEPVSRINREYGTGQQVPLIYLPGRPETFVINRFGDQWGVPLLLLVLGLILLLLTSVFAFSLETSLARSKLFGPVLVLAVGGIFAGMGFGCAIREVRLRAADAVGVVTDARRGGIWNWVAPIGVGVFGAFFVVVGLLLLWGALPLG
jgi:hypothetical protein